MADDRAELPQATVHPTQNVLILGGQSNMAGADALIEPEEGLQDLAESGLQTDADRRTRFMFAAQIDPAHLLSQAWGDVRGHRGTRDGNPANTLGVAYKVMGPEVGIARVLAERGWQNVVIIKVSANFQQLENGRSPWVRPNALWQKWSEFLHAQLGELREKGGDLSVRGFVWHQGIDDGLLGQSRRSYETDLIQLVADLRAEFATSTTPFILARSVNSPIAGKRKMAPIREAQVTVAKKGPAMAWIDTDDLTPYQRYHHLSAQAQMAIGRRMGEALVQLTCHPPALHATSIE